MTLDGVVYRTLLTVMVVSCAGRELALALSADPVEQWNKLRPEFKSAKAYRLACLMMVVLWLSALGFIWGRA